uniref:Uncharacterized protein n=1 Tax=Ditylenchus dipsaci TaxID=166011 RepID=A0A915DZH9_9BILA
MEKASLKEQLVECVDDIDAVIKQVLEKLLVEKKLDRNAYSNGGGERLSTLVELFQQKVLDYNKHIKKVENHREQEEYISALTEATYQAEKKLKSVKESETNRAFLKTSSDCLTKFRNSYLYIYELSNKNETTFGTFCQALPQISTFVKSQFFLRQQGDPQRPFPTEADFATSSLQLRSIIRAAFLRQSSASNLNRTASSGALGHLRGSPMNNTSMLNNTMNTSFGATPGGPAKSFSPSPRSGIFGQVGMGAGSSSPGGSQREGHQALQPE